MKRKEPAKQKPEARMEARPKAPQGMPFSLTVPGNTADDWLASIELRTRLLLDERKELAPDARKDANEAVRVAALARLAIAAGNVEGAALAAMLALDVAWSAQLKVGARDKLLRDRKRQEGARAGVAKGNATKIARATSSRDHAVTRFKALTATGDRDGPEAIEFMVREGWELRTLQRHLKGLLRPRRRKPVKPRTK